jgi:hypothetical protein
MSEHFIFTEAYNCSEILKNCLESFYKYHDDPVHVFCTKNDLNDLKHFKKIIPILIQDGSPIDRAYAKGHVGTAAIFAESIFIYSKTNNIIHFDSDLIFKQECLSNIKNKLSEGYDLVGPVRPYKFNLNNRNDIRHMRDVVATCFLGFNKSKISIKNMDEMVMSINGRPFKGNPTLDFFDYVSFDILENGGKIHTFDYEFTGGPNEYGNRKNKYGNLNEDLDCGDWFIHFAGIGTGSKVYKKGYQSTNIDYSNWALKRYALYKKLIENIEIAGIPIDEQKYQNYKNNLIYG